MKKTQWLPALISIALFILTLTLFLQTQDKQERLSPIIIKAFNTQITSEDFAKLLYQNIRTINSLENLNDDLESIKKKVIYDWFKRLAIQHWAHENNILISSKDVNKKLKLIEKNYPSEVTLHEALLLKGTDLSTFKNNIRISLLEEKLKSLLSQKIQVSQQEIKTYFKSISWPPSTHQVKLRHILVKDKEEAVLMLKTLKKKSRSFAYYARKFSLAPEGKTGGIINWIDIPKEGPFKTTKTDPLNTYSEPIESLHGYHIYSVIARRQTPLATLSLKTKEIKSTLSQKKVNILFQEWIKKMWKKGQLEINEEALRALEVDVN